MRKQTSFVVFWLSLSLVLAGGATAEAQSCGAIGGMGPSTYVYGNESWWYFDGFMTAITLSMGQTPIMITGFYDGATGTAMYGVDWRCQAYLGTNASIIWDTAVMLTNNKICSFSTHGGATCQIRGSDGLPVELMDFTVD